MGDKTAIGWTDATWNPMTGCTKLSPGCDNCYMFEFYGRLKRFAEARGIDNGYLDAPDVPRFIGGDRLDIPARWKRPRKIFVCSMSDLFHTHFTNEQIATVFDTMLMADHHIYQVLTKRANRVRRWWDWYRTKSASAAFGWVPTSWPEHIWLGTSVENSLFLPRIKLAAGIAPITFLSAEPLLGPLSSLGDYLELDMLQWVIVGGESGPSHRPMNPEWAKEIRDVCAAYGVPFHFKQWGGRTPTAGGRELDGRTWDEMPSLRLAVTS